MGAPACGERGSLGCRAIAAAGVARRRCVLALLLGIVAASQSAPASSAEVPTIESASDGPYGSFVWRPPSATIAPGGTVNFKSASAAVPHSVSWRGGPETPSCNGVPIDEEKTSWSGSCAFAQPGAYPFVCSVHPVEMKGTITVSANQTPTPNPPPPGGSESPVAGRVSAALKLRKAQRGSSVRGSIALSEAGAGGKLQIDLLSRRAALQGAGHSGTMRVGRLVRSKLTPGRLPFTVTLKRFARRALKGKGDLPLIVRITVRPPDLKVLRLKRRVVLHG